MPRATGQPQCRSMLLPRPISRHDWREGCENVGERAVGELQSGRNAVDPLSNCGHRRSGFAMFRRSGSPAR